MLSTSSSNASLTPQISGSAGCGNGNLPSSWEASIQNNKELQDYCDHLNKHVTSSSIKACCAIIANEKQERKKLEKYIVLSIPDYFIKNTGHNILFSGNKKDLDSLFHWFVQSMFPSVLPGNVKVRKVGAKLRPDASETEQFLYLVRQSLRSFAENFLKLSVLLLDASQENEICAEEILNIIADAGVVGSAWNALPIAVLRRIEKTMNLDQEETNFMRQGYVAMLSSMAMNRTIIFTPAVRLTNEFCAIGKPRTDLLQFVLDPINHNKLFPPMRSTARKEQTEWCQSNFFVKTPTKASDGLFFNKSGTLMKGCALYYSGTVFHETPERKLTKEMNSRALEVTSGVYILGNYDPVGPIDFPAKMNRRSTDEAQWKFVKPFTIVLQRDVRGLEEMFMHSSNDQTVSSSNVHSELEADPSKQTGTTSDTIGNSDQDEWDSSGGRQEEASVFVKIEAASPQQGSSFKKRRLGEPDLPLLAVSTVSDSGSNSESMPGDNSLT